MNKQRKFAFSSLKKLRFSRRAIAFDYSMVLLITVVVALPVLMWRMTDKIEEQKKVMGEDQAMLLRAPYDKEDMINYVEKAASFVMPDIVKDVAKDNGFLSRPCGGTLEYGGKGCAIVNIGTKICRPNVIESFTLHFNKKLDAYIGAFNNRSFAQIPKNNYDVYLEGNNVHAIATLPVKKGIAKKGMELDTIGNMWFAPSFTVKYEHKLEQYKSTFGALATIADNCLRAKDVKGCIAGYSYLTAGWELSQVGSNYIFVPPSKACYVLAST